jgi:hypothetical protein
MKPCRWCGQQIEPSALRCHHCRTWQHDGADREEIREAQILDRGIIYWGKFLSALVLIAGGVFLAFGNVDVNRARQQVWEALVAARTSQADAERSSLEAGKMLEEGKAKLANLEKELDKQRKDVETQIEFITGRARSVQDYDPSKFGDNLKNLGEAITVLQRQVASLQDRLLAVSAAGQAVENSTGSCA